MLLMEWIELHKKIEKYEEIAEFAQEKLQELK